MFDISNAATHEGRSGARLTLSGVRWIGQTQRDRRLT
jgi:hypothetical protein